MFPVKIKVKTTTCKKVVKGFLMICLVCLFRPLGAFSLYGAFSNTFHPLISSLCLVVIARLGPGKSHHTKIKSKNN